MRSIFYFSVICVLFSFCIQCNIIDYNDGRSIVQRFVFKYEVFPEKPIYKVNDTFWLQFKSQNNGFFINEINRQKFSWVDHYLNNSITIYDAFTESNSKPYSGYFEPIMDSILHDFKYSEISTPLFIKFNQGCTSNLNYSIGIIPKKKGLYILSSMNKIDLSYFPSDDLGKCRSSMNVFKNYEIKFVFNTNIHSEFLDSVTKGAEQKEHLQKLTDNRHIYWFQVK